MSETDESDPREQRAQEETMDVSLLRKGGVYEIRSASGNRYTVDVAGGTCTCLDWQQREPDGGCKHLRRIDAEIKAGDVPRPDGRIPERSVAVDGGKAVALEACTDRIAGRVQALDAEIELRRTEQEVLCTTLAVIEEFYEPNEFRNQADPDTR
jgi:hypothetical protein